jgi:hypothetical protein
VKVCSTCGKEKSFADFQVRKASGDGYTASCKCCLRDRDRARYPKEKERRKQLNSAYMQTEAGKASHARSVVLWKEANKVRRAANVLLGNAVKRGRIQKLPCFVCGDIETQGHHPDYDRPLDVIWLCAKHHREAHDLARDITNEQGRNDAA